MHSYGDPEGSTPLHYSQKAKATKKVDPQQKCAMIGTTGFVSGGQYFWTARWTAEHGAFVTRLTSKSKLIKPRKTN